MLSVLSSNNKRSSFINIITRFRLVVNILFILVVSFPSGLFYVLSGSTLSFWLLESGIDKIGIGIFGLVNFLHIFKFVWGPILEKISFTSVYGYKFSIIAALLGCTISLYCLTFFNPVDNLYLFAVCLVTLSLFSSLYEMLIQSSQMLLVNFKNWGMSEAACTTGFRLGILVAGSGALYLSTILSWSKVYQIMAGLCIFSLLLIIYYPIKVPDFKSYYRPNIFWQSWQNFINKPKWILIIIFMLIYRLQDNLLSVMPNLFYLDIGYSKTILAFGYKAWGMCAAIVGGFFGGYLCRKYRYNLIFRKVLVSHALSGLCFVYLFYFNKSTMALYFIVFVHEFTKGLTLAPFFSYQLKCSTKHYCITHVALLTSIASAAQILLGSISGYGATYLGWPLFFIVASLCCIPAYILTKYLP